MEERDLSIDDLWLHAPEDQDRDVKVPAGHLCSCDNVCVAVTDDTEQMS